MWCPPNCTDKGFKPLVPRLFDANSFECGARPPHSKGSNIMKIKYDKEADAAYIQMSSKKPDGAVEIAEGVVLHTTEINKIVAIEILDATRKIPINTLYKLELPLPVV